MTGTSLPIHPSFSVLGNALQSKHGFPTQEQNALIKYPLVQAHKIMNRASIFFPDPACFLTELLPLRQDGWTETHTECSECLLPPPSQMFSQVAECSLKTSFSQCHQGKQTETTPPHIEELPSSFKQYFVWCRGSALPPHHILKLGVGGERQRLCASIYLSI